MPAILRWFEHDGRRHRAWFRNLDDSAARELVLAGPDREIALRDVEVGNLEELTEEALVELTSAGTTSR